MRLRQLLQKAFAIVVISISGCSAMYVVTEKNKDKFSTAELCVYAYDYQNLPMVIPPFLTAA